MPRPKAAGRSGAIEFQKQREELTRLPLGERFEHIIRTNLWAAGSKSGLGSELAATAHLRSVLPPFLARHGVRSLLDVPCGDFGWLSMVDLGVLHRRRHRAVPRGRERAPLRRSPRRATIPHARSHEGSLPRADLVLCRDCLVHLSFDNIERALANIRASGAMFLLTTTFLEHEANIDIEDGDWRMVNLERRRSIYRRRSTCSSSSARKAREPTPTRRWASGRWRSDDRARAGTAAFRQTRPMPIISICCARASPIMHLRLATAACSCCAAPRTASAISC